MHYTALQPSTLSYNIRRYYHFVDTFDTELIVSGTCHNQQTFYNTDLPFIRETADINFIVIELTRIYALYPVRYPLHHRGSSVPFH